jgi:hypothetical protein
VTGIVIDASVTLSWCFPDEQTPMSLNVLDRLKTGERALVPAFWSVEVLNILLLGERKGRITPEQTKAFFDTLRALNSAAITASHLMTRSTLNWPCVRVSRWRPWISRKETQPGRSACFTYKAGRSALLHHLFNPARPKPRRNRRPDLAGLTQPASGPIAEH